jgi:hypothetical protein
MDTFIVNHFVFVYVYVFSQPINKMLICAYCGEVREREGERETSRWERGGGGGGGSKRSQLFTQWNTIILKNLNNKCELSGGSSFCVFSCINGSESDQEFQQRTPKKAKAAYRHHRVIISIFLSESEKNYLVSELGCFLFFTQPNCFD